MPANPTRVYVRAALPEGTIAAVPGGGGIIREEVHSSIADSDVVNLTAGPIGRQRESISC